MEICNNGLSVAWGRTLAWGETMDDALRENGNCDAIAAAVRAERKRLRDVLDILPAYVILLSPDYHVPFANRFFEERFGKSGGRRCYEYLFNRTEPCENCESYKVLKTGKPHHWEWTGPDGRNYDIHDLPFNDSDDSPLILEMGVDITERKQAEAVIQEAKELLEHRVAERTRSLEKATEELKRSNQDLQQYASVASHDLQEPLRAIHGFLTLLDEKYGPKLDAQAREYIAFAVHGADRMSNMVRDLLAYSRVDRMGKKPELVDTEQCLATALANLDASIREAGIKITHDKLPKVKADRSQLTQLLQNLIGNAIKFRKPDEPCLIHVGADQIEGQWRLFVRDNGIGIAPEQHQRVFDLFQRLHAHEKYPGTGLGLAICKRIVERHGGRIWVESLPGEGATFHFSLPPSEAV